MNVLEVAIRKIILDGSILILFFRVALDLVAWTIKNLLAKQESQVWFLGWEDSLEKGMATHSSIAWESHGKRSLAGYSPWCHKESDMTERLSTHNYKRYQNHISFSTVHLTLGRLEVTLKHTERQNSLRLTCSDD